MASGVNLTVNAETIKVDPGVKVDVGTGSINLNAVTKDNGLSVFGITTTIPVLGTTALVDISPDKGDWSSGDDYDAGDVVVDPDDHQQYQATHDVDSDTTKPHLDSTNWALAGSTQLIGAAINLNALAETLKTTVDGAGQDLSAGTLKVADVSGFPDTGTFTVAGATGTCTYNGRGISGGFPSATTNTNTFQNVARLHRARRPTAPP